MARTAATRLRASGSDETEADARDASRDGRAARSQRTRDAVVEALLDLIEAGDPRPTARRVAEQAGVSLRSVYVHFEDLEDLFIAAAGRHLERMVELATPIPADGPLPERIEAFAAQRCRILERVAPVRKAAVLQEPFSPALARVLELARKGARDEVGTVFTPELDRYGAVDRKRLLDAADVAASSATWETLRKHSGLSAETAYDVVALMLTALLGEDG